MTLKTQSAAPFHPLSDKKLTSAKSQIIGKAWRPKTWVANVRVCPQNDQAGAFVGNLSKAAQGKSEQPP